VLSQNDEKDELLGEDLEAVDDWLVGRNICYRSHFPGFVDSTERR